MLASFAKRSKFKIVALTFTGIARQLSVAGKPDLQYSLEETYVMHSDKRASVPKQKIPRKRTLGSRKPLEFLRNRFKIVQL